MTIFNQSVLADRARDLEVNGCNGMKMLTVLLASGANPSSAYLKVYFHNSLGVVQLRNDITANLQQLKRIFTISGGQRKAGGFGSTNVKAVNLTPAVGDDFIELVVEPVGDYSTYTLSLDSNLITFKKIDPLFSDLEFKFRPGCFSINCAPEWEKGVKAKDNPLIDYLAKDFESFKHAYIAAMMDRVPGWQPTSEADLDMVLLELFSAGADGLSDFQDRVMQEAYLATCRKRVSLERHSRLMDYHLHQGQQASTVLALQLTAGQSFLATPFPAGFKTWTNQETPDESVQEFISHGPAILHHLLNQLRLYTWGDSRPALAAGSTSADLAFGSTADSQANAELVRDLIRDGSITRLLIQEWLNPDTGDEAGSNPDKRQILRLLPGDEHCWAAQDPVTAEWYLRINWESRDQLRYNYCFTILCPETRHDITFFHGNLMDVFHGRKETHIFKAPGSILTGNNQSYFEIIERYATSYGAICRLDLRAPLAYRQTALGNEVPAYSTLKVRDLASLQPEWIEVTSLVHSMEDDQHFVVETDENRQSLIRFGNGLNGKNLPQDAELECACQVGLGTDGNIGKDRLMFFDSAYIQKCWNPFDVTNGMNPEPFSRIIRRATEAYLSRQLRAVTEEDYVKRAEELPMVAKAAAKYLWIGSWRTVRVCVDPKGGTELALADRELILRHLDAVRLIGEDIELRLPYYVPLKITVQLCIHPQYWVEDVKYILEQEFCDGYTPDGRQGFFHPDRWTFGQSLFESEILGRIQKIIGVDHVVSIDMSRWNSATPGSSETGVIEVAENEVIQVKNNPDHMEQGMIFFLVEGGRR